MSIGSGPPAGWYLDPEGSGWLRWYDGTTWSEFKKPSDPPPEQPRSSLTLAKQAGFSLPVAAVRWDEVSRHWARILERLSEQSTLKQGSNRFPRGYPPKWALGHSIEDIGRAWGQPLWWTAEPATGGAMAAWRKGGPEWILHLTADAICDDALTQGYGDQSLSWRLRRLGNIIGRPRQQIEQALGTPTAASAIDDGVLLQWSTPQEHIAIAFDLDAYCQGITHQSVMPKVQQNSWGFIGFIDLH